MLQSHPQNPETKLILFQCAAEAPELFNDQVNVNVRDMVSVQQFTRQFLTDKTFFPDLNDAITNFPENDDEVIRAATDLFENLKKFLPKRKIAGNTDIFGFDRS